MLSSQQPVISTQPPEFSFERRKSMKDFRDLKVCEKAHQLTIGDYKITASFPSEERYGLAGQLRRSASSIPANIAEGCGRARKADR
jgi:hypothetical protein